MRTSELACFAKTAAAVKRSFVGLVAVAAAGCFATTASAATIMKLSLGNTTADMGYVAGSLNTFDDGVAATLGNQNTAIDFVGPLSGQTDIPTPIASFSLSNVNASGPATVTSSVIVQPLTGGTFAVYDAANTLLLSGTLANSAITGSAGAPGTGSVFTTSFGTITGGTLAPQFDPNSLSMSITLLSVNAGTGMSVNGNNILQNFSADSSVDIAATVIPEPMSAAVLLTGLSCLLLPRHSRQQTRNLD